MLCRKNREGEREGFDREPVDSLALVALCIKKVLIEPRAGPDKAIFSLSLSPTFKMWQVCLCVLNHLILFDSP